MAAADSGYDDKVTMAAPSGVIPLALLMHCVAFMTVPQTEVK